jgi:hypothetical protein
MTLIAKIGCLTLSLAALLAGHSSALTIALSVIGFFAAFSVAVSEDSWRQSCTYISRHPAADLILPLAWRHASSQLVSLIVLGVAIVLFVLIEYTLVSHFAGPFVAAIAGLALLFLSWFTSRLLGSRYAQSALTQLERQMGDVS